MPFVSSNQVLIWLWNADAPYSSVSNLLQMVWSVPECSAKRYFNFSEEGIDHEPTPNNPLAK